MAYQVGDYVRFRPSAWDDGLPRPHQGRVVRVLKVMPIGVCTTHPRDVTQHRWGLALEFEAATEDEFLIDQLTH